MRATTIKAQQLCHTQLKRRSTKPLSIRKWESAPLNLLICFQEEKVKKYYFLNGFCSVYDMKHLKVPDQVRTFNNLY
jgi:hypothetical protein